MKNKPANITINLVPRDPFFQTSLGKTLKWALSVGRYIVIFTELIVIISFASRFSLDRQVTDLNDSINQKETVIKSYGPLEDQVRTAQQKIDQYQQIEQRGNVADVFPKLSEITPRSVRLDQLVIRANTVSIEGIAFSQNALNTLINNLQLSPDFFNVSIDRIESSRDQATAFQFRIRFDTTPPAQAKSTTRSTESVNILDRTQGL